MMLREWSRQRGGSSIPAWLSLAQGRAKDGIRWLVQAGLKIVGTIGSTFRRDSGFLACRRRISGLCHCHWDRKDL